MGPKFEISGLRELVDTLRNHAPAELHQKILVGAVGAGAAVIRDEAILRAPVYSGRVGVNHPPPGTLRRAIYQYRVPTIGDDVTFRVTVKRGKSAGLGDAYYALWVETGHLSRNGGIVDANPYMRPAFEVKKQEAVAVMSNYIAARLPALLNRTG